MAKPRKPLTIQDLEDMLDEDVLFGPIELAYEELRSAGLDPSAIAERGAALGQALTWQARARQRLAATRELIDDGDEELPRDRAFLLARIEEIRSDPRLTAQVEIAFRDRQPGESDIDELIGLLKDIRLLRKLEDAGPDEEG